MSLPKAVQEQEDAANQLLDGDQGNPSQQAPAQIVQAQETPVIQQIQPVAPVVAPNQGNPAQSDELLVALQHRFDVLQGKLNTELPRFAEQVKALQLENDNLKTQVDQKAAAHDMGGALESLSEFLDEDQVTALNKVINGQLSAALAPMREEVATTRQEIKTSLTQAQSSFYGNLSSMAPNWEALNNDPGFKTFLASTARDGMTLSQLIKVKFDQMDAAGVASIFREYVPVQNTQLDGQIMPGRGGAGGQPDTNQQPQSHSPEQIEAHYSAVRRGEISEKDHVAFESQLFGN